VSLNSALLSQRFGDYAKRLNETVEGFDWNPVVKLTRELEDCWREGRQVLICGNGGSAGNAIHLANDFLYGISKKRGSGIRMIALSANPAVMSCLANDVSYDHIYSMQIAVKGRPGDVLIVLSGSGNSSNIIEALKEAKVKEMKSYAILGFSGGESKKLADTSIHFPIDDMQISEDLQIMVGHMVMQSLYKDKERIMEGCI